MAHDENMPEDPWIGVENSNLQRDIQAVELQKQQEGITWAQYVGRTIDLFQMGDYADSLDWPHVRALSELLPKLQEAERLEGAELPSLKRRVTRRIQYTLEAQRELMRAEETLREEH